MSWSKTSRHRRGEHTGRPWGSVEVETLVAAVGRAPSVHNSQPWSLDVHHREATLLERTDAALERHDPQGRDRRLSCGAAVTNLVLAVRHLGWAVDVVWADGGEDPEVAATVLGTTREPPTATEGQRYRAITRRSSYRRPFHEQPLPHSTRETLRAAATSPAVYGRWVVTEEDALALGRLLSLAARVFRDDPRYQRELASWTVHPGEQGVEEGIPADAIGSEGLPAVGLATSNTHLPDESTLAERIGQESVLILSTISDERHAHLRIGAAMELAWLSATSLGVAASVMTQPLQLSEVRTGLAEKLALPGVPQVVMRFGYAAVETPTSARRPVSEAFLEDNDGEQW